MEASTQVALKDFDLVVCLNWLLAFTRVALSRIKSVSPTSFALA